jgi:hypothetical protein
MHTKLDALSAGEIAVLARVRLDVAAHLAAEAGVVEPALNGDRPRAFVLKLACPGCPPAYVVRSRDGKLSAISGGERPRGRGVSLTLRFLGAAACARALSGGGGTPIPIPRGPGALAALAYFRAAAPRAAGLIGDAAVPAPARARMMAVAALRGLAAVGSTDPALAQRLAHVPDGSVAVSAPGAFSLGIEKRGVRVSATEAAPERPNARLAFADAGAALAVLSGRRPAVVALGAGEVTVNGLLPLVQGMFAVLDRLAEYLAVTSSRPGTEKK